MDTPIQIQANQSSTVWQIANCTAADFSNFCAEIEQHGYQRKEKNSFFDAHNYCGYAKENDALFINYFSNTDQVSVVLEKNCKYFDFADAPTAEKTAPQITQVHLEDFGMSYVIRLCDGRFVIIDGGREFEQDADRLFNCLKEGTPHAKPIIAAWILTHPHSDHHLCLQTFLDKYIEDVQIEKFLYNYPAYDDLEHFPAMQKSDRRVERNTSPYVNIPVMEDYISRTGAEIFMPHTGQTYTFADATFSCLACLDDGFDEAPNINATSLVFRMTLCGQTVLWGADASFSASKLPQKYKAFLKSDILQVPHHGFQSGDPMAQIEAYQYIKPSVCFLPVSTFNAYTVNVIHRPSSRFLMENMDVDEWITGDPTRTITLPYTPPAYKKTEHKRLLDEGIRSNGCKTWIFSGLNTGNPEDMEFTFLNMTLNPVKVWIEFFFETEVSGGIRYVTVHLNRQSIKTLNITGDEVDDNDVWFNWMSMAAVGIPENADFGVRFLSDAPIVISHKTKKESHKA